MSFSNDSNEHAPEHSLNEHQKRRVVDNFDLNNIYIKHVEKEIHFTRSNIADIIKELTFPNGAPIIFILRDSSKTIIQLSFDRDVAVPTIGNQKGSDLEMVIVPLRDYNHTNIIGGHVLFIDSFNPKTNPQPRDRAYCDYERSPKLIKLALDLAKQYLDTHGETIYV